MKKFKIVGLHTGYGFTLVLYRRKNIFSWKWINELQFDKQPSMGSGSIGLDEIKGFYCFLHGVDPADTIVRITGNMGITLKL